MKDRTKVMKGMKSMRTARRLLDGWYVHYNFIRPHQALNGKTPAEQAGIDLGLEGDRWAEIIKQSVKEAKS